MKSKIIRSALHQLHSCVYTGRYKDRQAILHDRSEATEREGVQEHSHAVCSWEAQPRSSSLRLEVTRSRKKVVLKEIHKKQAFHNHHPVNSTLPPYMRHIFPQYTFVYADVRTRQYTAIYLYVSRCIDSYKSTAYSIHTVHLSSLSP